MSIIKKIKNYIFGGRTDPEGIKLMSNLNRIYKIAVTNQIWKWNYFNGCDFIIKYIPYTKTNDFNAHSDLVRIQYGTDYVGVDSITLFLNKQNDLMVTDTLLIEQYKTPNQIWKKFNNVLDTRWVQYGGCLISHEEFNDYLEDLCFKLL